MTPYLSEPVVLLYQSFEQAPMLESGEGVSEGARLRAALLGAYEYVLHQVPRYEFSSAVFYNQNLLFDANPPLSRFGGQEQFKVVEDIEGTERTLMIESMRDGVSIELVEVIPLDRGQLPIEFRRIEVSARRRTIRYGKDSPPQALKIRVSGVNVMDRESVNACVWAGGWPGVQFHQPLFICIDRSQSIRVDLLDNNPRADARVLEEHLLAVFGNIFGKASGRDLRLQLQCDYRYEVADGGLECSLPVLLSPLASYDENLSHALSSSLKKWWHRGVPDKGTFVFDLSVFATIATGSLPKLRLRQLLLPVESIAGLK